MTDRRRFARGAIIGALVGLVPYIWILSGERLDFGRTALPQGYFSNFFDIQARSLLQGRLDLPSGSLSIESFIVNGRTYMYFPPFPSFLRMPIMLFTDRFDGRLTVVSMIAAAVVAAVFTARLLWRTRTILRPDAALSTVEVVLSGVFVAAAIGGSTLLYLASLPWVYHEVYAWSLATAVFTIWAALGVLIMASPRRIALLAAGAAATVLTRTTVGWGCIALVLLCAVVCYRRRDRTPGQRSMWAWVAVAALVPLAASFAFTWIKFGSPFRFLPLESQAWTSMSSQRQQALAANGGGLTNLSFLPTTMTAYLSPTGIRVRPYFPFITLPPAPPRVIGGVVFDQTYRTGSLTAFMPFFALLSVAGVLFLAKSWWHRRSSIVALPVIGMAVATFGVLCYGYMANRYLADFMPLLLAAGSIGLVKVCALLERAPRARRMQFAAALVGLAAWGGMANGAAALTTMNLIAGGNGLRDYVGSQVSWAENTPATLGSLVRQSYDLPAAALADTLQVIGDCDALLIASGESHEPWRLVTARSFDATIRVGATASRSVTRIARFRGQLPEDLSVEFDGVASMRFVTSITQDRKSEWFDAKPGENVIVGIRADTNAAAWVITGGQTVRLDLEISKNDYLWFQRVRLPEVESTVSSGVSVEWSKGEADPLCRRLLAADGP